MIFVFSGCDKTGKSTASQKLAEFLQATWIHYSKPPENDAYGYFHELLTLAKVKPSGHVIADRWCEGSKIYAKVCGHKRELDEKDYQKLLVEAAKLGLVYIFCFDDDEAVAKRFADCGETFLRASQISSLQDEMWKEAKWLASLNICPVISFNCFRNQGQILSDTFYDGTKLPLLISLGLENHMAGWKTGLPTGAADTGNPERKPDHRRPKGPMDKKQGKKA